jgi:hypothetical protein
VAAPPARSTLSLLSTLYGRLLLLDPHSRLLRDRSHIAICENKEGCDIRAGLSHPIMAASSLPNALRLVCKDLNPAQVSIEHLDVL